MSVTPAILGVDIGDLVGDTLRALVELVVPDFGADWVSRFVTWLVALPPITGDAFPALNRYAHELTAVGFGLLGACLVGALLQLGAGAPGAVDVLKRTAIAAGVLAAYPTLIEIVLVGVNILTAQMIRHPLVVDGLDKAFGEALVVAVVTSGVSLGLSTGAALAVLYFLAALFVLKIGLTAALAVAIVAGALVWGLHPLHQAAWLTRAWAATVAAALLVPVAWACVFSAAALLAADTLVFESGGSFNRPLGDDLSSLVKPFAAVACFWLAYRAPGFLVGLARSAGVGPAMLGPMPFAGRGGRTGAGPQATVRRGVQTNADRFRATFDRAKTSVTRTGAATRPARPSSPSQPSAPRSLPARLSSAPVRANRRWRELATEGRRTRTSRPGSTARRTSPTPPRSSSQTPATQQRSARTTPPRAPEKAAVPVTHRPNSPRPATTRPARAASRSDAPPPRNPAGGRRPAPPAQRPARAPAPERQTSRPAARKPTPPTKRPKPPADPRRRP